MIVYLIRCRINGRCYVGKTARPHRVRWNEHKREARRGRRVSALYYDMRRFGCDAFEIELLAEASCSRRLAQLERKFIAEYRATTEGYNETPQSLGGRLRLRRAAPVSNLAAEHRARIAEGVRLSWDERRRQAAGVAA